MSKVQDVGPCKYVLLNSMEQKGYLNLTTDEPQNTVGFYQEIKDFMTPERQYINETQNEMKPGVVYELKPNTHYQVGVVNLRTGVSYNIKFWRETTEYSAPK